MLADSTLLFTNAAGRLLADPAGFLRAYWTSQPRTLADTQRLFASMSEALRQHGWSKILVNQVAMRPFSSAEQQWVTQEWLPQAVQQGGYRHGAVVVSTDIYARLATSFITANVGGLPLRYRSFDEEAEATAWLAQQPG
ncbi:MAG: STAS/SEC14 domain-containing protein [Janthinobacterium lividum]